MRLLGSLTRTAVGAASEARTAGGDTWRARAAAGLGKPGGREVVILADPACPDAVQEWLREFSHDQVTIVAVDAGSHLDDIVARLSRLNAQDVIVAVLGPAAMASLASDQGAVFAHLFLHLCVGGAYVVDRTVEASRTGDSPPGDAEEAFHRMLEAAQGPQSGVGPIEIARYVKDLHMSENVLVATKRGRHALKLREHEVADLLPARESGISPSVLEVREPGELKPRMQEASYGPSRAPRWPARLEYPQMSLRHYEGDLVSTGGMRLRTGNTVLPESFRWPHAETLRSPRYPWVTPLFARVGPTPSARVLDGDFYFLDCVFSGHFGHVTTEVLCRLWGWDRAKREIPGLKVLFHTNPARPAGGTLERRLFAAYGVAESDIVSSDRPVRLRSVVGASPMWHNTDPYYVHPDLRETWERLTAGLLAGAAPAEHERIFASRGASLDRRRGCRNQQEVERFFADRGYHVFYPEEMTLAEQVSLFAGARVVAGFAGSAMCNLMHAQRLEAVIAISHNAYQARNEHLFTSLLGGQLHYFWQPSEVEPPKTGRGRSKASDRSSFAFDFANYGDDLARVLVGL